MAPAVGPSPLGQVPGARSRVYTGRLLCCRDRDDVGVPCTVGTMCDKPPLRGPRAENLQVVVASTSEQQPPPEVWAQQIAFQVEFPSCFQTLRRDGCGGWRARGPGFVGNPELSPRRESTLSFVTSGAETQRRLRLFLRTTVGADAWPVSFPEPNRVGESVARTGGIINPGEKCRAEASEVADRVFVRVSGVPQKRRHSRSKALR